MTLSRTEVSDSEREHVFSILRQTQQSTISFYERLPNGTEVWIAESAPRWTKLEVTLEELAESACWEKGVSQNGVSPDRASALDCFYDDNSPVVY